MRFVKLFTLDTCAPCKVLSPLVDELASAKHMLVSKFDIKEHKALADIHGIRKVPTLVLFKDDKKLATHTGAMTRQQLEKFLDTPS